MINFDSNKNHNKIADHIIGFGRSGWVGKAMKIRKSLPVFTTFVCSVCSQSYSDTDLRIYISDKDGKKERKSGRC